MEKTTTSLYKAVVLRDVFSMVYKNPFGKGMLKYASKNDIVTIISDRGNVLVVEDSRGRRFPIKSDDAKAY